MKIWFIKIAKNYKKFLFLVILLSSLHGTQANTAPHIPIQEITCYSTNYPPYVIVSDLASTTRGIDVDLLQEVERRSGIKINVRIDPWLRIEYRLKNGDIDCVFAFFDTKKRKAYASYSKVPMHVTNYTVFVPSHVADKVEGLVDLTGKRIGVNAGFQTTQTFENLRAKGEIIAMRVKNDLQSFKMIATGRLDAVLTSRDVGDWIIEEHKFENISAIAQSLVQKPAYLVVRPSPELHQWLELFDRTLQQIYQDGTVEKIKNKYLSHPPRPTPYRPTTNQHTK